MYFEFELAASGFVSDEQSFATQLKYSGLEDEVHSFRVIVAHVILLFHILTWDTSYRLLIHGDYLPGIVVHYALSYSFNKASLNEILVVCGTLEND